MLLEGKVAIITGAGAGLGLASAQVFVEHGARLLVSDIEADRVEQAVARLSAIGGEVFGKAADVAREADVEALVGCALDRFGKLDVMFNNAGFDVTGGWAVPLEETPDEIWRKIIDINLGGVFYGIKHAARAMKLGGGGSIINTSSAAALRAVPDHGIYAAAKAGVTGLTRNAAVDLGKYAIRVNAIAPASIVPTNWAAGPGAPVVEEEDARKLLAGFPTDHIPLGRFGERGEIGKAALFLASDLSSFVTGVTLPVDGGVTSRIGGSPPQGPMEDLLRGPTGYLGSENNG